MSHLSFAHVSPEGFASFNASLQQGDWASIDISPWEAPNQTPAQALGDAPVLVFLKLRLTWSLAFLLDMLYNANAAKDLDTRWDNGQKQLNALLAAAAVSADANKREAAKRLQKVLLLGAGEAQTKLKYRREVDFAHQQAMIVAKPEHAQDIGLLGLGPAMADIAQATSALAAAIGHGDGDEQPAVRYRLATSACSATFGYVAQTLGWLADYGMPGDERDKAVRLRASLADLAACYPAPVRAGGGGQNAAPNPAGAEGGEGASVG